MFVCYSDEDHLKNNYKTSDTRLHLRTVTLLSFDLIWCLINSVYWLFFGEIKIHRLVVRDHFVQTVIVKTLLLIFFNKIPNSSHLIIKGKPDKILIIWFNYILQNVVMLVIIDVQRLLTRSRVCSSAKSVVQNVCVFHLELMATNKNVRAITDGKLRKENRSAPNSWFFAPTRLVCEPWGVASFVFFVFTPLIWTQVLLVLIVSPLFSLIFLLLTIFFAIQKTKVMGKLMKDNQSISNWSCFNIAYSFHFIFFTKN